MFINNCKYCDCSFEAQTSRATYCSTNCKSKAYYERHKDKQWFKNQNKARTQRQRDKRGDEINARRRERFAEDPEHRVHVRKIVNKSRKRKPQTENYRQWMLNNPYKAMLKNLRKRGKRLVNYKDLKMIFERDEHTCQYCGSQEDLSLDHKIPVSRGGNSSVDNLCLACQSCNSSKGAKTVEEFLIYLEEIKC